MSMQALVYSKGTKVLHWIVALLVILMLSFSFFLEDVPKANQGMAYMIHKSVGLTILMLMLIRLFWIVRCGRPPLPSTVTPWERTLAKLVQYSFYGFLLLMPFSGWIMSLAADRIPTYFGLFEVPLYGIPLSKPLSAFMNQTHIILAWVLVALVSLHILGALKHRLVDKDNVLERML